MSEVFKENIKKYVTVLQNLDSVKSNLKENQVKFDEENKELKEQIEKHNLSLNDLKSEIENEAKLIFEKDSSTKKLYGGIGIQEKDVYEYDVKKALDWGKEKDMCLMLDKKAFEKIIKVQELDFVTKKEKEEVKVTFPKVIKIEE